ncbi:IS3 family transposase [Leuconostoc gelidum subsp. aenigmaticum]|nr:IS3 family transposase [Leuconostoc gelidum subsp. aenigmaticum]
MKSLSGSTNREKQTAVTSLRQTKRFKLNNLLDLAQLKRSTYYYLETHPINSTSDNKLVEVIHQIKSPQFQTEYGYLRVTTLLHDQGYLVNRKRVVLRMFRQNALLSTTYNTRDHRYNSYRDTVRRIAERVIKRDF